MITQDIIKRFAIHKKTGIDINVPKVKLKPNQYKLIERCGTRERVICTMFRSQYGILTKKRKELMLQNPNFYGKHNLLVIEPIF